MTGTDPRRYTCAMCGTEFREDRGQPACRACPLTRLCGHVRCPNCGHENPAEPGWVERAAAYLRRRFSTDPRGRDPDGSGECSGLENDDGAGRPR